MRVETRMRFAEVERARLSRLESVRSGVRGRQSR